MSAQGRWVEVGDGVLARRHTELDLTTGLVLGGGRALVVDTHTDHDVIVHVPDAAVVFAGDLVEQGAPPDLGEAVIAEWPATLHALLALHAHVVVPGHGEPVAPAFVTAQRDELAEVATLHAAVATGELDAATAARRSPHPDVPWPAPPR